MKRLSVFLVVLAVVGLSVQAYAALFDRGADSLGNHLIYDSDLNITWYDYTKSLDNWQNQVNWASGLTVPFDGNILSGWRLPATVDGPNVFGYDGTTAGGFNITSSEMGHLYYTELGNKGYYATDGTHPQPGWGLNNKGPLQHLLANNYWSGTVTAVAPGPAAWSFGFSIGEQYSSGEGTRSYALAVRPGDVSSVPEPGAIWLLGLGLAALCGYWRKATRRHG